VLVKSDLEVCLLEALIAAVAKWLATISRGLSSKELELKKIAGGAYSGSLVVSANSDKSVLRSFCR
jgi:hypothetical protein